MNYDFDSVWDIYRRKVGKFMAHKAFVVALSAGISAEDIYWGVRAYMDAMEGKDHQFILHCSTFINQRRFEDEYEVTRDWGKQVITAESVKARAEKQQANKLRVVK